MYVNRVAEYSLDGKRRRDGAPQLCGCYRLQHESCAGLTVYEPDGQFSQYITGAERSASCISGRWWVHNASSSFAATYPPHDGLLVEHEVHAASDRNRVGNSEFLQYVLSEDGRLAVSRMELVDGNSKATATTHWKRVLA